MAKLALPCIVCGGQLENIFPDVPNQPGDGVAFSSPGYYGSTLFDPVDGSRLEVNVCDSCLRAAADKQQVHITEPGDEGPRFWDAH